ncbi:hypothetical protein EDB19DRAFT_1708085 [Suillus lakei]|nr:hypothetical protein EDB19DRAFT_1708085 [Suillus lakei]
MRGKASASWYAMVGIIEAACCTCLCEKKNVAASLSAAFISSAMENAMDDFPTPARPLSQMFVRSHLSRICLRFFLSATRVLFMHLEWGWRFSESKMPLYSTTSHKLFHEDEKFSKSIVGELREG